MPGEGGRQVLGGHAQVGVDDMPDHGELAHRALSRVDRHGEADALRIAGVGPDLGVDPDHAPACVEERSTRVAVRDRSIGLDRVHDLVSRGQ